MIPKHPINPRIYDTYHSFQRVLNLFLQKLSKSFKIFSIKSCQTLPLKVSEPIQILNWSFKRQKMNFSRHKLQPNCKLDRDGDYTI